MGSEVLGNEANLVRPTVLGAGSWGTALALVLARRGLPVRLWVHRPELAESIQRTRLNEAYLPGFLLPGSVHVTSDLAEASHQADVLVFAVPSHAVRATASLLRPFLPPEVSFVSASKGIECKSLQTMSQVLEEVCGSSHLAVLSGPSFALEVARQLPTALVAASRSLKLAQAVQQLFSGPHFRVYVSEDVCGVELGGAVKNVIAIAAGVCHGLELGQNAVAALITRGLAEMSRLAVALGAQPQTLSGLAGLGDLVLTCNGQLSRNRQVGIELASGRTVADITSGMQMVAEGIRTAESVVALGRREKVSLPISEQMHAVLLGRREPTEAIRLLLERSPRGE